MILTTKNILLNIPYYAILYILIHWILLTLERHFLYTSQPVFIIRFCAVIIGVAGILIQLWGIIFFQKIGKGTPIPSFSPRVLVTEGPYKWVRNPINIGELMLLFSFSLWFMSITLFIYSLLAAVAFQIFIVAYEEPKLKNNFGEEYIKYASQVNRGYQNLKHKSCIK